MFAVFDCDMCDTVPSVLVLLVLDTDSPTGAVPVGPVDTGNWDSLFVTSAFAELDFDICEAADWVLPVLTVSELPGPETTKETPDCAVLESTGNGTAGAVPLDLTVPEFAKFVMSDAVGVGFMDDLAGNRVEAPLNGLTVALDIMGTGIIGFGASELMVEAGAELDPEAPVEMTEDASGDIAIDCGSVDGVVDGSDVGVVPERDCVDLINVELDLDNVDTSLEGIKLVNVRLVAICALGNVVFSASGGVSIGPGITVEVSELCVVLSSSVNEFEVVEVVVDASGICVVLNSSVTGCADVELVIELSELCVVLSSSVVDFNVLELMIEDAVVFDAVAGEVLVAVPGVEPKEELLLVVDGVF